MSRILVFGKTGQVATELLLLNNIISIDRTIVDLDNPKKCADIIALYRPSAVINAAAFTDVDAAEKNEALAFCINAKAPAAMSEKCADLNIPFVHISTDYVFSGLGQNPWKPGDRTDPQNIYGKSKLAGENAIKSSGSNYVILRTSWIFSKYRNNFVKTILRISKNQDALSIVSDQIGGPTPANAIARACISIAHQLQKQPSKSGIYHLSGSPDVSWHDFARAILLNANKSNGINAIMTQDYNTLASRPLNSKLDCTKTEKVFKIYRPDWNMELKKIILVNKEIH